MIVDDIDVFIIWYHRHSVCCLLISAVQGTITIIRHIQYNGNQWWIHVPCWHEHVSKIHDIWGKGQTSYNFIYLFTNISASSLLSHWLFRITCPSSIEEDHLSIGDSTCYFWKNPPWSQGPFQHLKVEFNINCLA